MIGASLPEGFEWISVRSSRIRCVVCGRIGYPAFGSIHSWTTICQRGHLPCPKCGRMLSVLRSGSPRAHPRCPKSTEVLVDNPGQGELT